MNLKEEILKLTNTAPLVRDEQDLSDDDTAAKICSNDFDGDLNQNDYSSRKFRSFNDLSQVSDAYRGKVVSRKKIDKEENGFESDEEYDQEDDDDLEEDEEEEEEEEKDGDDLEKGKIDSDSGADDDNLIKIVNERSNSEIAKGVAIRNQINFWEILLDNRMKYQNLLSDVNKYPKFDELDYFVSPLNENQKSLIETNENLAIELLNEINDLTNNLSNSTRKMTESDLKANNSDEDEDSEISSLSDDEENEKKLDKKSKSKKRKSKASNPVKTYKKLKFDEFEKYLDKDYNEIIEYRNMILQKWYEKTSAFVSKNNIGLEKPILQQIENLLLDKKRIVKRTQLKRIDYEKVSKPKEEDKNGEAIPDNVTPNEDYDVEIFDDNDFYQQLLRELVNRRTFDISDPILLSKHSIELQKLQIKKKKKVDTKASKGRKLKFDIHKQLVNVMVPIYRNIMTQEAMNDLFSELFQNHAIFGTS